MCTVHGNPSRSCGVSPAICVITRCWLLLDLPILEVWKAELTWVVAFDTVQGQPKKRGTLLLSISIDRFSKFFHWHTLRTICDNVIITYISHHTVNASLHYFVKYQ